MSARLGLTALAGRPLVAGLALTAGLALAGCRPRGGEQTGSPPPSGEPATGWPRERALEPARLEVVFVLSRLAVPEDIGISEPGAALVRVLSQEEVELQRWVDALDAWEQALAGWPEDRNDEPPVPVRRTRVTLESLAAWRAAHGGADPLLDVWVGYLEGALLGDEEGDAFDAEGALARFEETLARAEALSPTGAVEPLRSQLALEVGDRRLGAGDAAGALPALQRVGATHPQASAVRLLTGFAHRQLGSHEACVEVLLPLAAADEFLAREAARLAGRCSLDAAALAGVPVRLAAPELVEEISRSLREALPMEQTAEVAALIDRAIERWPSHPALPSWLVEGARVRCLGPVGGCEEFAARGLHRLDAARPGWSGRPDALDAADEAERSVLVLTIARAQETAWDATTAVLAGEGEDGLAAEHEAWGRVADAARAFVERFPHDPERDAVQLELLTSRFRAQQIHRAWSLAVAMHGRPPERGGEVVASILVQLASGRAAEGQTDWLDELRLLDPELAQAACRWLGGQGVQSLACSEPLEL